MTADLGNSSTQGEIPGWSGDDYTFDVAFTLTAGEAASDVANAAPGKSNVTWTVPISVIAKNTTQARNSDWSHMHGFAVSAYWKDSSPACQYIGAPGSLAGYCGHPIRRLDGATGSIGVGAVNTLDATLTFDPVTVNESAAASIVSALSAGPDAWLITDSDGGGCGPLHIMWSSDPANACSSVPSTGPAGESIPSSLGAIPSNLKAIVDNRQTLSELSTCPISSTSFDLAPGLTVDGVQYGTWKDIYVEKPIGESAFPDVTGVNCQDGGMDVGVYQLDGVTDVESYLANADISTWSSMSEPIPLESGKAWVAADTITPVSGKSFDIERFAWSDGKILIVGQLVAGTPAGTVAWLKFHLGTMLNNLAAVSPSSISAT